MVRTGGAGGRKTVGYFIEDEFDFLGACACALSVVFGGVGMIRKKADCIKRLDRTALNSFMWRSAVAIVIGFVLLLPVMRRSERRRPLK